MCNYYICNPNAKKLKKLSFSSVEFQVCLKSVYMAFDPLISNHYKLICVSKVDKIEKYQIAIYSSETNSWSPLRITFTLPDRMEFSGVFCNGAVHWYSKGQTSLYFDVDKECLNTMPMPNLARGRGIIKYFGESRGHLHLIEAEYPYRLQLDVLEMAADYSEWFVRYHVNLDAVRIAFPDIIWYRQDHWIHEDHCRFSVLHVIRTQKEEESVVVVFVDNKTISFNVHDGISKKLFDLEPEYPDEDYTWRDTFQYFEILTSV